MVVVQPIVLFLLMASMTSGVVLTVSLGAAPMTLMSPWDLTVKIVLARTRTLDAALIISRHLPAPTIQDVVVILNLMDVALMECQVLKEPTLLDVLVKHLLMDVVWTASLWLKGQI